MEPTQEQIKEFWELCEARCIKCGHLITKETITDRCCCYSYELNLDLNNLFKSAVPRLMKLYYHVNLKILTSTNVLSTTTGPNPIEWLVEITHMNSSANDWKSKSYQTIDKNLTLALFWTIWKVFKGT